MIRLWRQLIKPILEAAGAKSIMEIGAEFGASTNVLLKYVHEQKGHLYCIDPVPEFDADEFQQSNANTVTFYRDLSLNVLPGHKPFDAAMVDGDHNWYTVYNELKQIEKIHRYDPLLQPIIFVHDISWPYGRRDLYYNPATVPEEFQQAYDKKGILPKRQKLLEGSGINRELCNSIVEGGARNGVLTAVEDFLEQSKLEYEFINYPLYFGLGVLIAKQRVKSNAKLQAIVDEFHSREGAEKLIKLAEHLRCVEIVIGQALGRQLNEAQDRIAELEEQLKNAQSSPKSGQDKS